MVEVAAAALSPLARAHASGAHYSAGGGYPLVAGVDGDGRLGDGRPVYFLLPRALFGAMAERTVVADGHWASVPDGIDDALAAAIANPGMSGWAALTERAILPARGTVLVNGAAGRLAVPIARHLGAGRVIAAGRNRAVPEALRADETIPLDDDGSVSARTLEAAFESGIDVVLDYMLGPSALALLTAVAKAAPTSKPVRFVQIGSAGGAEVTLPASVLLSSSLELVGSWLGSIPLPRLVTAVAGVLGAANRANLFLQYETVPLVDVAAAWAGGGERVVFRCG